MLIETQMPRKQVTSSVVLYYTRFFVELSDFFFFTLIFDWTLKILFYFILFLSTSNKTYSDHYISYL